VRRRLPPVRILQRHAGLEAHHVLLDARHCRLMRSIILANDK
jgi:hypothetical protein